MGKGKGYSYIHISQFILGCYWWLLLSYTHFFFFAGVPSLLHNSWMIAVYIVNVCAVMVIGII